MGIKRPRVQGPRLSQADGFALRAAEGWLELQNPAEASVEMDRVTGKGAGCLEALLLRWRVLYETGRFEGCLDAARALTRRYPGDVRGWIRLAETFYQLKQFEKAYRTASAKVAQFPGSSTLLHDAACYSCLVGKFEQARTLFARAMAAAPLPSPATPTEANLERLCVTLDRSRGSTSFGWFT